MNANFFSQLRPVFQGGQLTIGGTFTDYEVRLSFEDTGKGINAGQTGKLFQPFSTTRSIGTGHGLLIVRRIIREHGGEIDTESREGQGTCITLWRPLVVKNLPHHPARRLACHRHSPLQPAPIGILDLSRPIQRTACHSSSLRCRLIPAEFKTALNSPTKPASEKSWHRGRKAMLASVGNAS